MLFRDTLKLRRSGGVHHWTSIMLYLTKNTDDQNIVIYICGDGAELIPLEMLTLSLKLRDYFLSSVSQKVVSE